LFVSWIHTYRYLNNAHKYQTLVCDTRATDSIQILLSDVFTSVGNQIQSSTMTTDAIHGLDSKTIKLVTKTYIKSIVS